MPPKNKDTQGFNFSRPQPELKVLIHDTDKDIQTDKTTSRSKHVAFKAEQRPNRASEIGDISKLGLGFDGKNYDYSGMMKLIIDNVLVAHNTTTPSLNLLESQLRIIILPNETIGMATSDAKYHALVVRENQAVVIYPENPENTTLERPKPYAVVLRGHACASFGLALQSLLWKSVVGLKTYAGDLGVGMELGSESKSE